MASETEHRVLYGAGGHARVVQSVSRAAGLPFSYVYADDQASAVEFAARLSLAVARNQDFSDPRLQFHIAIGSAQARQTIDRAHPNVAWCSVRHPSAIVSDDVAIEDGVFIGAGAIIQCGAKIGRHAIINTGAIVEHDCVVGDYGHVAPGAILSGNVRIGTGVLIGAGATVMKGCSVEAWTTVGAGATVVRDLVGFATAVGVPARGHRVKPQEP